MSNDQAAVFRATLPPTGSAIKMSGNGEGARVQLDVPEQDIDAVETFRRIAKNAARNRHALVVVVREATDEEMMAR